MTKELEERIRAIYNMKGGQLDPKFFKEFIELCQENFNYRPDISCGKCIYKHVVKLYDKYLK